MVSHETQDCDDLGSRQPRNSNSNPALTLPSLHVVYLYTHCAAFCKPLWLPPSQNPISHPALAPCRATTSPMVTEGQGRETRHLLSLRPEPNWE